MTHRRSVEGTVLTVDTRIEASLALRGAEGLFAAASTRAPTR